MTYNMEGRMVRTSCVISRVLTTERRAVEVEA